MDERGHSECLLGNEAIVRGALEAGVGFASGYPGTPSSEVTDSFARVAAARGIAFEYSVNEKVALEMAFAASLAGARSICAMKHLGLMVAGDPLSTIPYVGTRGGMVIVSAGDPSCHTSPNEQDQRHLGPMLHIPVLDPSTPQQAHLMARSAFELSEASSLPVILRVTTRVAHSRAPVSYGPLVEARVEGFERDPQRLVPIPVNARRLRLLIPERLEAAGRWMAEAGLFERKGSGKSAILAAGAPAATCADLLAEHGLAERVVFARVGGLWPLPEDQLIGLLREVERVLVVEELSPFVEDALLVLCGRHGLKTRILGKRSGHLPVEFEYEPEVIQRGLHEALELGPAPREARSFEPVPPRPPVLCPGCPHRSTFFAARAAFGSDQLYFNDIGCYTLGYGAPLGTCDALLCMGAGFTLAAGVSRVTGERTVGVLGDSTFFHAGMPPLLDAIKEEVNMVAVILDNQVTAMTGFQESPTVEVRGAEAIRRVSIEGVARALGARHVETIDPADLPAAIRAFERARDARGVSVIVAERACPVDAARRAGPLAPGVTYEIDPELCGHCGREGEGLRCGQETTEGLERHMSRSRALSGCEPQEGARVAPCATRCPLALCVQGYAGHIASGQYREAVELIEERCPLPDSVCRVCHRPCEAACIWAPSGEPVAINDLKRFAMERAKGEASPVEPNGRAVAAIGAGPAGLAAAHDLAMRGYRVTLFDEREEPGGLLRYGIPEFRLPREALACDVRRILARGVAFEGGRALGRDLDADELLGDGGYDAVFLATGAHRPRGLGVPEEGEGEGPTVVDALSYLADVAQGRDVPRARRVVVAGGGNAAFDAGRAALRLGAEEVTVAYRRSRAEMPALPDEIEAAGREGIAIRELLQPAFLQRGEGRGLTCLATELGEPDESGRRRPVAVPGSETCLAAELVIAAVGQDPDLSYAETGLELATTDRGDLEVEPETCATSHPGIFAGGDAAGGPRTVTDAIAWGQRAAWAIDRSLRGEEIADRRPPPPRPEAWTPGELGSSAGTRVPGRRERPGEIPVDRRLAGFEEVVGALDEERAQAEARRCAACGRCGNCRACLDLFGCPAFHLEDGRLRIDPKLCNACGVCAIYCPNGAIHRVEEATP